jgi:hypothetical protein
MAHIANSSGRIEIGELLTTQEVCQKIKRGPHTLRRWELQGLLKAFRPAGGRRKLYRADDIQSLVTGQPVLS